MGINQLKQAKSYTDEHFDENGSYEKLGGGGGWSGGAMVLGKLPVPGRPAYLD